jgi:phenylacetate-CoA ligase
MLYEALFKHALFPIYETVIKRRASVSHNRDCEKNQWLAPADLHALQLRRLNELLAHCWANVPFLRSHWSAHGMKPGALRHVDELAAYPTLTKSQITANYEGMVAKNWQGRTMTKQTGGSTGDPFHFEYTMDSYTRRVAAMWRGYGWAGANLGARTAYLWGTGMRESGWGAVKDKLYHGAFARRFFDVTKLTEQNIDERIAELAKYKPDAVVGYVAPLALIARRMIETGQKLSPIRGVISAAEALYEPEREVIEQAFGCKAFNTYGSREVMLMAAECDHHAGLHVTADQLVFETLDLEGRPTAPGQSGEVAVTDLFNYGMPLVRYLNGDCATYATQACSCGRSLPLLSSVDGRLLDLIKSPDGRVLPGEMFVAMSMKWPAVHKYQVVQTAPDALQFRLVLQRAWSEPDRSGFIGQIRKAIGPAMHIEVAEVDDIPTNATGKRRVTVSLQNLSKVATLPADTRIHVDTGGSGTDA